MNKIKEKVLKEKIEILYGKFRKDNSVKHFWEIRKAKEEFSLWLVLMFGKYCREKTLAEVEKVIDECEISKEYGDPKEDEYDYIEGVDSIRELISKRELKQKISEEKK